MLFLSAFYGAQSQSVWTELGSMPMAVANNAVTQAHVGDTTYVYSFGGIDTTKALTGITQASMKYNTITDVWSFIPDLPDTLGKIASGASTVNNIIYITGGYHVFPSSPFELSSDKIHRYDPVTNNYLSDGMPMPFPIDDQVQAVWRDSLIFMITGWSDNGNVSHVQIYDPAFDSWQVGTSTPNNNAYQAFGASGVIIGDTIFYNGGAAGSSFNSVDFMRKGLINPDDPTDIVWDLLEDSPGAKGYRMASVAIDDQAYWIGGSGITYNYDGIAYNGSGGVPPLHRILSYNSSLQSWYEELDQPYGVMDLRGVAKIDENKFIICGGMTTNQTVSDKTFLICIDVNVGLEEVNHTDNFQIYPNPVSRGNSLKVMLNASLISTYTRYNVLNELGQRVISSTIPSTVKLFTIPTGTLSVGFYTLELVSNKGNVSAVKIVVSG